MADKNIKRKRINPYLSGRNNYYGLGSFLNQSLGKLGILELTASNADTKLPIYSGLTDMGKGLIGGIGTAVGLIGGNLIGGGLNSSAADAVNAVGSTVGGVVSTFNPLVGNLITAGSGLISGLTRRFTGYSVDKEGQARLLQYLNMLNNLQVDDSSNASVADAFGSVNLGGVNLNRKKYKNGWFNNKGTLAYNKDIALETAATLRGLATLENASLNADTTMDLNLMANFAAYGGPLFALGGSIHIKPENRGKFNTTKKRTGKTTEELTHSSNPLTRKRAIFALNASKWKHAFGGELGTNGADFTNGLIFIDNGGSHESNPYGGVPMGVDQEGTPNLVEEGEVVFNDYVFSNRLRVPKAVRRKYKLREGGPLTFADAVKKLSKESEERPNDPISLNGLLAWASDLMMEQENIRLRNMKGLSNKFDWGGFKDIYGDRMPDYIDENIYNDIVKLYILQQRQLLGWDGTWINYDLYNYINQQGGFEVYKPEVKATEPNVLTREEEFMPYRLMKKDGTFLELTELQLADYAALTNLYEDLGSREFEDGRKLFTVKERDELDLDYPDIDNPLRYAPAVGSAIGLGMTLFSKPDYSEALSIMDVANNARHTPVSFKPIGDYLVYNPLDRDYYLNLLNALAGATRRNIMNVSGGNRGLAMSGLLAADYNALAGVGDTLFKMDTYNNELKAKTQEFNRATNMTNSQGFLQADMANQNALANYRDFNLKAVSAAADLRNRERMARENAISQGITGLFDNLGAIGEQNVINAMVRWADKHGVSASSYSYTNNKNNKKKNQLNKDGE